MKNLATLWLNGQRLQVGTLLVLGLDLLEDVAEVWGVLILRQYMHPSMCLPALVPPLASSAILRVSTFGLGAGGGN